MKSTPGPGQDRYRERDRNSNIMQKFSHWSETGKWATPIFSYYVSPVTVPVPVRVPCRMIEPQSKIDHSSNVDLGVYWLAHVDHTHRTYCNKNQKIIAFKISLEKDIFHEPYKCKLVLRWRQATWSLSHIAGTSLKLPWVGKLNQAKWPLGVRTQNSIE